jgi:hypothetical protein
MFRRFIAITMVSSLCLAQAPSPQTGSDTAMVLKGKAPVSRDVLKIKLPRPHEADLPNGLHLMVLEDHRLPQINVQIIIPGAGGYYDPAGRIGLAQYTAQMMREGTTTRTAADRAGSGNAVGNCQCIRRIVNRTRRSRQAVTNFDRVFDIATDVLLNQCFRRRMERGKARAKPACSNSVRRRFPRVGSLQPHLVWRSSGRPRFRDRLLSDAVARRNGSISSM